MTNTKFRKKALLSSVAMLLVALVALGSATFAWFVANPTVTASGLKMSTSAAAGLSVASDSCKTAYGAAQGYTAVDAFGQSTILRATGTITGSDNAGLATNSTAFELQPAAPKNALNASNAAEFGYVAAAAASAKTAATEGAWATQTAVYSEDIYVKTTTTTAGDSADVNAIAVKVTPTGSSAVRSGLKVMVVAHQAAGTTIGTGTSASTTSAVNQIVGVWKVDTTGFATGVTADDSQVWKGSGTGANALEAASFSYYNSAAVANISSLGLKATSDPDTTKFTVYVYLDGENSNVYSSNVPTAIDLLGSIDVKISSTQSITF